MGDGESGWREFAKGERGRSFKSWSLCDTQLGEKLEFLALFIAQSASLSVWVILLQYTCSHCGCALLVLCGIRLL